MSDDEKTIGIGSSINTNPTNPCDSLQVDHNGNLNNLPAIVDTRSYYSPFGMTVDLVSPSHTCYDPVLLGARIRDPIMACVRTDEGDWPGNAVAQTILSNAVAIGNTVLQVTSSNGFQVGEFVLLGDPGVATNETKEITGIIGGPFHQIIVRAIENNYPIGTPVITGPNDYAKNPEVGFGGTSHSCPTVAGAAALLLSIVPDLTWIELRNILRESSDQIDTAQANIIGQWVDLDGDGVNDFSQWYGYGRLNVEAAINQANGLVQRADIVIRDNLTDTGAVPSTGLHAWSPDLWVRQIDDPIPVLTYDSNPPHQNPVRGQDNYVYMRVKNVGTADSNEVYLRSYIKHYAGLDFSYPDEWTPTTRPGETITTPLVPGTYLIGEERIENLAPNDEIIVKMTWEANLIPPYSVTVDGVNVIWHPCMLAEVSPHDGPAPATSANTWEIMKDNNLVQRNISIDDPNVGNSFAVGIVAGTSSFAAVESLIIDRSLLPADYRVFVRIAEPRHMAQWLKLLETDELEAFEPLLDSNYVKIDRLPKWSERPSINEKCKVILLEPTKLSIECCDNNAIIINAPADTEIGFLCREVKYRDKPKVERGIFQEKEVIFFDGGSPTLKLPLRLASREYIPFILGLVRPAGRRGLGSLIVTQLKSDGELSAGYCIEG